MVSWCCCCCRVGRPSGLGRPGRIGALERKIFLLVLGLDNAGKTCSARAIVGEKNMDTVAPTVGFSKLETRYKGFHVCLYDLGGSRGFRGIWPKYFHEVHGFIFVVDASDNSRISECREAFRELLRHDKVRGKPLLLLCNKSDVDDSHDEITVVDELNVERLVNDARCPTRVEKCTANRAQGLKVGYKWLVKSVIANMVDLGPRVEADIKLEERLEAKRRAELKKRIEERNRREAEEEDEVEEEVDAGKGFVPLSELKEKWAKEQEEKKANGGIRPKRANSAGQESLAAKVAISGSSARLGQEEEEEVKAIEAAATTSDDTSTNGGMAHHPSPSMNGFVGGALGRAGPPQHPSSNGGSIAEGLPPLKNVLVQTSSFMNAPPSKPPRNHQEQNHQLDLEPISRPKKKRNLLKKLNRTAPGNGVSSVYRSKSNSVDSSSGKPGSSKSGSSVESIRDSQVIKAYS